MKKWVVRFKELDTVNTLEQLNIISYKPLMYDKLKFVFIKTEMPKEEILKIEGITSCREERVGTVFI